MTQELQQLANLVKISLQNQAPILSGNLLMELDKAQLISVDEHEIKFVIKAPFYDMKLWKETGVILHTHEKHDGKRHYANWLNELGAFGKKNKSMHWVNRALNDAAKAMPNAEIINELEL